MPSDSTVGGVASVITTAETLLAVDRAAGDVDLAALLDAGHRVQVQAGEVLAVDLDLGGTAGADLRCRPASAWMRVLSSEQPTSTLRRAASPTTPATTRFIDLIPSFVRRPDGVVVERSQDRAAVATDPKLCRTPQVRFAGDAVIHGRRTTGPAGATALPGGAHASSIDRRRRGPGRAARHRSRHAVSVAVGAAARLHRRRSGRRAVPSAARLVKHLAMRRTLWVVAADDLPLIQAAASDRVADNERRQAGRPTCRRRASPTTARRGWTRACAAVLRHLAEHGPASARELRAALPELAGSYDPAPGKRWGGETPLAPRVLTVLVGARRHRPRSQRRQHGRHRDRGGRRRRTGCRRDAGAATPRRRHAPNWCARWLRTFGPATVTDVKWWFGNTLTWARQALRDIDAVEVDLDGTPGYVLPDDLEDRTGPGAVGRAAARPRRHHDGMVRPRLVRRRAPRRRCSTATATPARPLVERPGRRRLGSGRGRPGRAAAARGRRPRRAAAALKRRADELTEWLDGVRINPRFPSPLSRGVCVTGRRATSVRCRRMVSSQRSVFEPDGRVSRPASAKPRRRCRVSDPAASESTMTAIIWRSPRRGAAFDEARPGARHRCPGRSRAAPRRPNPRR